MQIRAFCKPRNTFFAPLHAVLKHNSVNLGKRDFDDKTHSLLANIGTPRAPLERVGQLLALSRGSVDREESFLFPWFMGICVHDQRWRFKAMRYVSQSTRQEPCNIVFSITAVAAAQGGETTNLPKYELSEGYHGRKRPKTYLGMGSSL